MDHFSSRIFGFRLKILKNVIFYDSLLCIAFCYDERIETSRAHIACRGMINDHRDDIGHNIYGLCGYFLLSAVFFVVIVKSRCRRFPTLLHQTDISSQLFACIMVIVIRLWWCTDTAPRRIDGSPRRDLHVNRLCGGAACEHDGENVKFKVVLPQRSWSIIIS